MSLEKGKGDSEATSPEELLRLLRLAVAGDGEAFKTLWQWALPLIRYARFLLGSESDAEDVFQETLISLLSNGTDLLKDDNLRLKAWLYTVTYRNCISVIRRRKTRVGSASNHGEVVAVLEGHEKEPPTLLIDRDQLMQDEIELERLPECLKTLDDRERQAICLKFYEKKTLKEIAAEFGLRQASDKTKADTNAVYSLLKKALGKLRDCVSVQSSLEAAQ